MPAYKLHWKLVRSKILRFHLLSYLLDFSSDSLFFDTSIVARPHQIDDVVDAKEVKDVKIDEAFLGSCNKGRIEE